MTIKVGDKIPSVTVFRVGADGPEAVSTDDLFAGRTVVLVSVPGAFTPVCSGQHLPGYLEHADEIRAKGVDDILCTTVNDVYVAKAWQKQSGADGKVSIIADDGSLVKALGLTIEIPHFGLGLRGQRFSMLVRDGVIEVLNVEEVASNAEVSGADYLLTQL